MHTANRQLWTLTVNLWAGDDSVAFIARFQFATASGRRIIDAIGVRYW